jgi:hypothetical protein
MSAPKYCDGRFLKYAWSGLLRVGLVRAIDQLAAPGSWVPIARCRDRHAVYFAYPRVAFLARAAWWLNDHKWDLDEWAWKHSLMWMRDGDYWRNAKWRFPWRRLPGLQQEIARLIRESAA